MKVRSGLFLVLCLPALAAAQAADEVIISGNPPLTTELASKFTRFMGWLLNAPLTQAQEKKVLDYLVKSWESADRSEANRVLMLIKLRDKLDEWGEQGSPAAREALRRDAFSYWRDRPSDPVPRWALIVEESVTRPIVPGRPPLTRQMMSAYSELSFFLAKETLPSKLPNDEMDAETLVSLSEALAELYPKILPDQQAQLAQLPAIWYQMRHTYAGLDDKEKAAYRAKWRKTLADHNLMLKVVPGTGRGFRLLMPSDRAMPHLRMVLQKLGEFSKLGGGVEGFGTGW